MQLQYTENNMPPEKTKDRVSEETGLKLNA